MDRLLRFLSLSVLVLLGGCTAMMESSTYGSGDLYITNNRERVAEQLTARAEAEMAEAEMRRAMYAAADNLDYSSVVANDYESAYARRLYGFNSPTYRLPASYYNLATSDAMRYATAYDPAFYNIMVSGDQVWVEPKYVTSMFGTWGATNVAYGIYTSPWIYGWGVYSSPYYYTMWGYPHYSWYDWHWNVCYNPYHWGCGYYAGYYPHHHHGYYPHYPSHNKPSAGDRFQTSERRNSASRYSSPTSRYTRGGVQTTTVRNSGATSSGMNSSRVNRGSSSSSSRSSSTSRSTTTSGSSSKSSSRTFKSSSTSVGSTVSSSSSSSSRGSSSSTLRSSGSSSSSRSSGSSSLNRSSSSSSSSSRR